MSDVWLLQAEIYRHCPWNHLKKMVGEDEQLTTKSKIDLSHLPPCRDNLIPYIRRVNHRLAIYKRAVIPIFWSPKPYDPEQSWQRSDEGVLEPVWSCDPVLPPTSIGLVEKITEEMEQFDDDIEGEQSDQGSDYEEYVGDNEDEIKIWTLRILAVVIIFQQE